MENSGIGSDSGIGIDPRIPLERVGDTQDLVTLPEEQQHMGGGWGGGSNQPVDQHTTCIYYIFYSVVFIYLQIRQRVKRDKREVGGF